MKKRSLKVTMGEVTAALAHRVRSLKKARPEKILIHIPSVAAALVCTSKDSPRDFLDSVYVHWDEGRTVFVGTDGHRMCVAEPATSFVQSAAGMFDLEIKEHKPVILPRKVVIELLKRNKKTSIVAAEFAVMESTEAGELQFSFLPIQREMGFTGNAMDAVYADYKRCLKGEEIKCEAVGFNTAYLASVDDVAKAILGKKRQAVKVELCGAMTPARFTLTSPWGTQALVVIMPMRL